MNHVTIVGLPRTGKTTLCADKLFPATGGVFINLQAENYFEGVPVVYDGEQALASLMQGKPVVWNAEPWTVREWLVKVYQQQRSAPELKPITIYIDEAHLIAPRGSFKFPEQGEIGEDNIVGVICTTGLRWNLRVVWITQRPQFMDTGVYRTARYHIFFTCDPADVEFFRQNGIVFNNPGWHDYEVVRT